ncbi:MAG: PAS domain-containing protein [Sulfuricella sp.]
MHNCRSYDDHVAGDMLTHGNSGPEQESLRESRERLALFAEITFEGIVISENGKVVDCNEQFAELMGYPLHELKGMSIRDLVVPEDRERVVENILLGRASYVEHAMIRKDGSRIMVEARAKNSLSNPHQRLTAVRDVSEHKRVLADLKQAQSVGRIGCWRLDIQSNELRWSDENHIIFGLPKGTPLSYETFLSAVHPEDRRYVHRMWKAALRGEPYDIEHRLLIDRQVKWVREKAEMEFDDQGVLLGGFGTTQDITDRKQVMAALKQSEGRFRAMVQAVPSLTFEGDAEGLNTFVSDSWCAYTGMSVEESTGWGWTAALHNDDVEAAAVRWAEAVRSSELFESRHRVRAADGSCRWFIARALPTRNAGGKVLRWAGSLTDIDDLVRAQQALQESDRRKDEFLAMLSHELRNPLVPIRNAAHVLGLLALDEPRIKWAQETIEGQVNHLTRLVDDLLDMSRIVRGKVALQRAEVAFADLAASALEAARPLVDGKGHQLSVSLPVEPVHLNVDPVRVTQVLLNLLDNAAKYTPDGGKIEFDARVAGQEIEIRVRDNGMGIPAELLPHVFDLFQQGERTLDRSQGGLGIGLTLVKQLVEMHGGWVEASSNQTGQGATLTVRLPIVQAPSTSFTDEKQAKASPSHGLLRVLVVDDDPAVADSTAMLLEMEGYEVSIATNGYAALEMLASFLPHAVLLDIGLEGMDGFETARRMRAQPEGRELCLMAVTGYGDEETRNAALAAGCDHHLVKPTHASRLVGLLAEVASSVTS